MENEKKIHKLRKRLLPFLISALFVIAYLFLNRLLIGSFTVCPFRASTGFPCPGCGLTHAANALIRFDIKTSLNYHALFIPVACTLVLVFFPKGILKIVDWGKRQYWWHALLFIAMLAYYGYRLKYCYPGKYPMNRERRYYLDYINIKQQSPEVNGNVEKRVYFKRLKKKQ